jgi:hypothetical protein
MADAYLVGHTTFLQCLSIISLSPVMAIVSEVSLRLPIKKKK